MNVKTPFKPSSFGRHLPLIGVSYLISVFRTPRSYVEDAQHTKHFDSLEYYSSSSDAIFVNSVFLSCNRKCSTHGIYLFRTTGAWRLNVCVCPLFMRCSNTLQCSRKGKKSASISCRDEHSAFPFSLPQKPAYFKKGEESLEGIPPSYGAVYCIFMQQMLLMESSKPQSVKPQKAHTVGEGVIALWGLVPSGEGAHYTL